MLEQTAGLHARVSDSRGLGCCLNTNISNKFAGGTAAAGQEHIWRTADPESDKRRIAVFPHHFLTVPAGALGQPSGASVHFTKDPPRPE